MIKVTIIEESGEVKKQVFKLPKHLGIKYDIWCSLIEEHGYHVLKTLPKYHDEQLKGQWQGYRSSRLNIQWRIIYRIEDRPTVTIIRIVRVSAHKY